MTDSGLVSFVVGVALKLNVGRAVLEPKENVGAIFVSASLFLASGFEGVKKVAGAAVDCCATVATALVVDGCTTVNDGCTTDAVDGCTFATVTDCSTESAVGLITAVDVLGPKLKLGKTGVAVVAAPNVGTLVCSVVR